MRDFKVNVKGDEHFKKCVFEQRMSSLYIVNLIGWDFCCFKSILLLII